MHYLKEPIPKLINALHLREINTGLETLKQMLGNEENAENDKFIQDVEKWIERLNFKDGAAVILVDIEQIKNITFTKTDQEVVENFIESIKKHILKLP